MEDENGSSPGSGWLQAILNGGSQLFTAITAADQARQNAAVAAAATSTGAGQPVNWKIIGGIAAGVGLLVLLLMFRKR